MATKKAVEKRTAVPAKKSAPSKAPTATKAPAQKMSKTQLIRYMAEQMEAPPKQIAAFFDLLIETATTQTRMTGEFIPGGLECTSLPSVQNNAFCVVEVEGK